MKKAIVCVGVICLGLDITCGMHSLIRDMRNRISVNLRDRDGNTRLHRAVSVMNREDSLSEIERIINLGANLNKKNLEGMTPLQKVIYEYKYQSESPFPEKNKVDELEAAAKRLIADTDDINSQDNAGKTALITALELGNLSIAKAIIGKMVELNLKDDIRDKFNKTALMYAAENGYSEIVKLLLERSDVTAVDREGRTLLHHAVASGLPSLVNLFIDCGIDIDAQDKHGGTPLFYALLSGHLEAAKILIEKEANRRVHGVMYTPLHEAADISIAFQKGMPREIKYEEGITCADYETAERIIRNARILEENFGVIDAVKIVVNAKNIHGITPLHIAAGCGNVRLVDLLIRNGAEVTVADNSGLTPLYYANHLDMQQFTAIPFNFKGVVEISERLVSYGDSMHNELDLKEASYFKIKDRDFNIKGKVGAVSYARLYTVLNERLSVNSIFLSRQLLWEGKDQREENMLAPLRERMYNLQ